MIMKGGKSNAGLKNNNNDASPTRAINFSVMDMSGNVCICQATTVSDMRIKLAIRLGVFYPCVELFNRSDYAILTDAHDVAQIFRTEPYEICVVNNEEGVKKEALKWDGLKWIEVLNMHLDQGGDGLLARAMEADPNADRKILQLVLKTIHPEVIFYNRPRLLEVSKIIKTAAVLGANVMEPIRFREALSIYVAAMVDYDLLRILVEYGVDINAIGPGWGTALTRAIDMEDLEAVQSLLRVGVDPNQHTISRTPLECAVQSRLIDIVMLLIKAGAIVNGPRLPAAVGFKRSDQTPWYDHQTPWGQPIETPLHLASKSGYIEMVRVLLRSGADANVRDRWGRTPYDVTRNKKCRELLSGQLRMTKS